MQKIIGWFLKKISFQLIAKVLYYALLFAYSLAIAAMWGSFIIAFSYIFNEVQNFVHLITSAGLGNDTVSKMFGLLNCIGFVDAFNNTKAVWLSGITFIMGRILYIQTITAYRMIVVAVTPLLTM